MAIRLGLLGIRVAELCRLTWSNLLPDGTIAWIGKGRRPRQVRIGPVFENRLARWQRAYERGLSRPVGPDDPLICRMNTANQHTPGRRPLWGAQITPDAFRRLLLARSALADLGHLAPHDLRRTTAKTLQEAVTADGAHLFDIDDIRIVLGHARIDTTQRYLDSQNSRVLDRAAPTLDIRVGAIRPEPTPEEECDWAPGGARQPRSTTP